MSRHPIGVFDSGVGGISIWKEIHNCLPHEDTIYLADSKYAPYGNKSAEEITALSVKNTEFLRKQQCKLIVVACNTATTNAIEHLRERYDIPFIGIEPAIKPAALQTQTKSIGILATKGTLSSALFHQTAEAFTKDISVIEIVGEGLVPLIEAGAMNSEETKKLLAQYMAPMLAANIDHLVLGCSHYPFLIPQLKELLPPHVQIIDSGAAVARQTKAVLEKNGLQTTNSELPNLQFYTNQDPATLQELLRDVKTNVAIEAIDF
ncbi:MAG: glutamate racemase [Flavobacteriaceae bacterium]|nr:glutamate racemase [Flavobacteriaceae bacterium]|tara:strand:- start:51186 stop:51974 length:789 start_codon:yes stop_codon:yes gene_type:complete